MYLKSHKINPIWSLPAVWAYKRPAAMACVERGFGAFFLLPPAHAPECPSERKIKWSQTYRIWWWEGGVRGQGTRWPKCSRTRTQARTHTNARTRTHTRGVVALEQRRIGAAARSLCLGATDAGPGQKTPPAPHAATPLAPPPDTNRGRVAPPRRPTEIPPRFGTPRQWLEALRKFYCSHNFEKKNHI